MRDASSKSNGYYYQRLYFCYFIIQNIDSENLKCIEEGKIDNVEYEDFTFLDNQEIATYQIKHRTTEKMENITTKDFLKTFTPYYKYENYDNIKNIYYIVSKNNNNECLSFILKNFNNTDIIYKCIFLIINYQIYNISNKYTCEYINDKYDKYIKNNNSNNNVNDNDYSDNDGINETKKSIHDLKKIFNALNEQKMKEYISKFIILEGYKYDDLKININDAIRTKLNIPAEKCNLLRLKLLDILTNNSFNKNELMEIKTIKNEINVYNSNINTNNTIVWDEFILLINSTTKYDSDTHISLENIIKEIKEIMDNIESNGDLLKGFNIDALIIYLNKLSKIYKTNNNIQIKNIYSILTEILCVLMSLKLHKSEEKYTYKSYLEYSCSINTYYHHNINRKIIISRCKSEIIKK